MTHAPNRRGVVVAGLAVLAVLTLAPAQAQAQLGVGARMAVMSGANSPVLDPALNASSLRFTGGFLRFKFGQLGAEVSLDYRNDTIPSARIKTYPLQATFLYNFLGGPISPYALGGIGWYTRKFEALADGQVVSEALTRNMGYHVGLGAELSLGRHAGFFIDYRYTFVNSDDVGSVAAGGLGTEIFTSLFSQGISVSNRGSMWTTGVAVYF